MGKGDISHLTYPEICDLCKHISRGKSKYGKGPRDSISRVNKSSIGGVSREDIGNLLDNFKTKILSTLGSQLNTLKIKQKKEVEDLLTIYCPKCRKMHPLKECPLHNIYLCGICVDNHATKNYPSLL
jgi:hypothetical protein